MSGNRSVDGWRRDPYVVSVVVLLGLVVAGFVGIWLGYRTLARTLIVAYEVPALVSGAIGGLALLTVGAVLIVVQTTRRIDAEHSTEIDAILDEATHVLDAAEGQRPGRHGRRR